jgi:hypothetical protein
MATSGTATFTMDLAEIIEEAGERCGYEIRSGYDFRTARRSLNLLFADMANRGLNMWTFEQASIPLVAGQAEYALPADTVDLMDAVLRTGAGVTQVDTTLSRISLPDYVALPNKTLQGRPIQMLVLREQANPKVVMWQVPDSTTPYTFVYWRLRRIQDAGDGANTADVPFRFMNAITAGLAYYLALKLPGAMDRLPVLQQQYQDFMQAAIDEDREKAPVRFVPRRMY